MKRGCPYHQSFGNGDAHITVTPEWFWLRQLKESNLGSLLKTSHSVIWCRRISLYWHQTYTVHYAVIWSRLEPLSVLYEKSVKSHSLGADHLTLEGGGGGGGGRFWKKISCERLSEESNCMQHKCNRKLMGKKGKKYPANQIARKKNSWWTEISPERGTFSQHSYIRGGSAQRSNPLPSYIPFLIEKVPLSFTFYFKKWYPFHMDCCQEGSCCCKFSVF